MVLLRTRIVLFCCEPASAPGACEPARTSLARSIRSKKILHLFFHSHLEASRGRDIRHGVNLSTMRMLAVCVLLLAEGCSTFFLPTAPLRVAPNAAARHRLLLPHTFSMCAGHVPPAMPPATAVEVLFRAARAGSDRPRAGEATEALASIVRLTTEKCNKKQVTPEISEVWGRALSGKTWRPFFSY